MSNSQHNTVLYVVTKPSLQAKALVNILASSLPITVLLQSIYHPLHPPEHPAIILFDLTAVTEKLEGKWQQHLKKITQSFKLLLVDNVIDEQSARLLEWPSLHGLFSMTEDYHCLIQGVREVLDNKDHFSHAFACRYQEWHKNTHRNGLLTEREKAILTILQKGASNIQIADSLFISKFTVKAHLYNIFKKLEVKNRTQAVHWMKENM